MSIAVFDIDGVVADVRHRLHHLDPPRSWSGFFHAADRDPLLEVGASLVAELAAQHDIVWLTGRPEWLRRVTHDWLVEHDLPVTELRMRPDRDRRPAPQLKLAALRRWQTRGVAAFIDDDPEVIAVAQAAGFPAVLADWVPRTDDVDLRLREAQDRLGRT